MGRRGLDVRGGVLTLPTLPVAAYTAAYAPAALADADLHGSVRATGSGWLWRARRGNRTYKVTLLTRDKAVFNVKTSGTAALRGGAVCPILWATEFALPLVCRGLFHFLGTRAMLFQRGPQFFNLGRGR